MLVCVRSFRDANGGGSKQAGKRPCFVCVAMFSMLPFYCVCSHVLCVHSHDLCAAVPFVCVASVMPMVEAAASRPERRGLGVEQALCLLDLVGQVGLCTTKNGHGIRETSKQPCMIDAFCEQFITG